ncbi:pantoate--beta-alanine ligase [Jannaschia sp. M317]|uniref:pantoate--beta-alanine ligase n=1 Tax=Jannaschia sp. M317 TaxID=2867011 RepID=UPI0021A7DD5B|nr:pantoate--beta-alanine ligase [Jannaschia sp. M317]UWQ18966.1 pantoate--beta-alanine ligase [Jannaschia sp. M317]
MQICRSVQEMRTACRALRRDGTLGFVPTMGGLHAGHMALVVRAAEVSEAVVASVFVNPTQFESGADLAAYPSDTDADLAALEAAGVAAVFLPQATDVYPEGAETIVEVTRLGTMLHGAVRPGHFKGVATVVTKLFNIAQPDVACFGKKDYQQLALIRRMVRDLHFGLRIEAVETVREADGLAMSSRNARLSAVERAAAPVLNQALRDAAEVLRSGGDVPTAEAAVRARIAAEPLATLAGFDVVEAGDFTPVATRAGGVLGMMISAQLGDVLLLDQMEVSV